MIKFATGLQYVSFYYNVLLLITIVFSLILISKKDLSRFNPKISSLVGLILFVLLLLFIGFRPNSYVFGDMSYYIHAFNRIKSNMDTMFTNNEWLWMFLMNTCARLTDDEGFIFTIACVYLLPCYIVSKKFFKQYWFVGFMMLWTSFSFWTYGTNGLRNGMGTSVFLLAFLFDNRWLRLAIMYCAIGLHSSLILPTMAYVATFFLNNSVILLRLWLLAIPLSLVAGGVFTSIFSSIGFGGIDQRMGTYTGNPTQWEYNTGFRIDFILYSATAVFAGWYYTEKLKYQDKTYITMYNIYLICNAFWILVIRAPFSNRFAYLSWFMMGLVIIYPLLKHKLVPNQATKIGLIILANYAFTYTLLVILGKG